MNPASLQQLIDFSYIAAVIGFILALKWLNSPVSAMRGVLIGEIASAVAVVATLFDPQVTHYKWIIVALIIGAGVGVPLGMVKMTAVPQRTALSHAFGAMSAALIGVAEYFVGTPHISKFQMGEIGLEVVIGSLTSRAASLPPASFRKSCRSAPSPIEGKTSSVFPPWA